PLIARSQAIFFSDIHASYGEVIDWIEAKKKPQGKKHRQEMLKALSRFRAIAQKAGFTEHLYQVEDRYGAPAHTHANIICHPQGDFYWVDRTPAMPIALFVYPYHFAAILRSLRQKQYIPLFDKINSLTLREYIEENMPPKQKKINLARLILYQQLRNEYQASRIDLFTRILCRPQPLKWKVRETTISYWQESRDISMSSAGLLRKSHLLFTLFAIADLIPFAGRFSRKIFLNSGTLKHLAKLLFPPFKNRYRSRKWRLFKTRSISKVTSWFLEDVKKMHDRGSISLDELHSFEEATKTKEWLTYIGVLSLHTAGKIPGDYIAAAMGGYAFLDIIKMIQGGNLYLSGAIIIGVIGLFLPGIYRASVTMIVAAKDPDVKFKWYWIVLSCAPTIGYLAMPLQILSQNLSNKAAWTLLGLKLHSNISSLLDIFPGYRELDFYVLSRLRQQGKPRPRASAGE
ncbi:hypothetical protein ACFL2W_00085, partial [Candidatus Omnitrophota bacterium]